MDTVYDARIRDPVPGKLKEKDVAASGNFSVMAVNLASEVSARDRHSAAKRSSENTVKAAKLAETGGYVSVFKRRAPVSSYSSGPSARRSLDRHGSFLGANTNTEQTRLLLMLRSLHPVLVVDQLCRALDFFGSKQKATTHLAEDGFPDSAVGNGPGPLFVSWMSEIFPDATVPTKGATHPDFTMTPSLIQCFMSGVGTRFLGGTNNLDSLAAFPLRSETAAESEAADRGTNQAGGDRRLAARPMQANPACQVNEGPPMTGTDETSQVLLDEVYAGDTTTKRRRGRPKGSKNKLRSIENPITTDLEGLVAAEETAAGDYQSDHPAIVTGTKRRGRGRPKGSKNKPKPPGAPSVANHNSLLAADYRREPGQEASNDSGAHRLAQGIGNEGPDGRAEWTSTTSGLNPGYLTDARFPLEGSLHPCHWTSRVWRCWTR